MEPARDGGFVVTSARDAHEAGHIRSAGFADLTDELCDPDSPHRFAVLSPERFCAAMGALGVGDDSWIVCCDRSIAAWAARVWWMLRWVGFDRVAVLEGGLRRWRAEGRPLGPRSARRHRRFRPVDDLGARFDGDRSARTIASYGGGIAASSDAFE